MRFSCNHTETLIKKSIKKLITIELLFFYMLFVGCDVPETSRSIIREIQRIDKMYSDDVARNQELYDRQQTLLSKLVSKEVLHNKYFFIHGVRPNTSEFNDICKNIQLKIQNSKCKVANFQRFEHNVPAGEPIPIEIWDTPDSMDSWSSFFNDLNENIEGRIEKVRENSSKWSEPGT